MKKYKLSEISETTADFSDFPASVKDGIEFLKTADFSAFPNGKTVIKTDEYGEQLYINILEYQSHAPSQAVIEKHNNYVDIQYVISGQEYMGSVKFDSSRKIKTPYNPETDMALFELETMPFFAVDCDSPQKFIVHQGEFMIFTPDDLHSSMIFIDQPGHVRKVIVKCRV